MRKLFVAAALVAACSVANAAEVKKDTKAPAIASKAMTDKDMDKVTAAAGAVVSGTGPGVIITLPGTAQALSPTPADQAVGKAATFGPQP